MLLHKLYKTQRATRLMQQLSTSLDQSKPFLLMQTPPVTTSPQQTTPSAKLRMPLLVPLQLLQTSSAQLLRLWTLHQQRQPLKQRNRRLMLQLAPQLELRLLPKLVETELLLRVRLPQTMLTTGPPCN
jgi:hypothetical protein